MDLARRKRRFVRRDEKKSGGQMCESVKVLEVSRIGKNEKDVKDAKKRNY